MNASADPKSAVRRLSFARRKLAHESDQNERAVAQATAHLEAFLQQYRGQTVAGYMPIQTEMDPRAAMKKISQGPLCCTLALPVVEGQSQPLRFDRWSHGEALKEGAYGARIPELSEPVVPQVLIVPLVAFSRAGHRLGYGGGYYDRTLAKLRAQGGVCAVGFAYSAQELNDLPVGAFDAPLDAIVTEKEILTIR